MDALRRTIIRGLGTGGLLAVLTIAALASVLAGLRNAAVFSVDFQWSAARLLLEGDDPYRFVGQEGPAGPLIVSAPYTHLLYVMLLPIALLGLEPARIAWASINILMVLTACYLIAQSLELDRRRAIILTLITLASTPFRVGLGNAQTSLLVLLTVAALFRPWSHRHLLVAGVSFTKWSFAPPIAVLLLLRGSLAHLALASTASILGFLSFAALTGDLSLEALLRPLLIQIESPVVNPGYADAMTALRLSGVPWALVASLSLVLLIAGSVGVARTFRSDLLASMTVSVVSLATVNHLSYDLILLVPVLGVALATRGKAASFLLAICLYFFFNDLPVKLLSFFAFLLPSDLISGSALTAAKSLLQIPVVANRPLIVAAHSALLTGVIVLMMIIDRRAVTVALARHGGSGPGSGNAGIPIPALPSPRVVRRARTRRNGQAQPG